VVRYDFAPAPRGIAEVVRHRQLAAWMTAAVETCPGLCTGVSTSAVPWDFSTVLTYPIRTKIPDLPVAGNWASLMNSHALEALVEYLRLGCSNCREFVVWSRDQLSIPISLTTLWGVGWAVGRAVFHNSIHTAGILGSFATLPLVGYLQVLCRFRTAGAGIVVGLNKGRFCMR